MAYKVFQNGTALTAEVMNDFIQEQTIARFTNATERNTAIPNPEVGQHVYLTSTNQTLRWEGSGWVELQSTQLGTLTQRPTVVCTSTTRPAHAAGRPIFETDTKRTYVSDGTSWNYTGGAAPLTVNLPLNSPWVQYDDGAVYEACRYWKDGSGMVHIKGMLRSTAVVNSGATIGTMPAGFRPARRVLQHGIRQANSVIRIDVAPDGSVIFCDEAGVQNGVNVWMGLNIAYPAA